jgi:hypothetical protein
MARMKRLVLVVLALAAFAPVSANAAVPCRDRVYNDWYADGKVATTYSMGCYRDALKHIPPDARTYSSLADDIRSAMRGAQARLAGHTGVPAQIGKGVEPASATVSTTKHGSKPTPRSGKKTTMSEPRSTQSGGKTLSTATVAAGETSGDSGGVPTPLIVLGGLALLLIAVGAVGAVAKRRGN